MQQPPPLFVQPTQLMFFFNISHSSYAYKKYKELKKILGKKEHQLITVKELADWLDIPEIEVLNRIK